MGIGYVDCAGVLGAGRDDGKADIGGTFKGLNIAVEVLCESSERCLCMNRMIDLSD